MPIELETLVDGLNQWSTSASSLGDDGSCTNPAAAEWECQARILRLQGCSKVKVNRRVRRQSTRLRRTQELEINEMHDVGARPGSAPPSQDSRGVVVQQIGGIARKHHETEVRKRMQRAARRIILVQQVVSQ